MHRLVVADHDDVEAVLSVGAVAERTQRAGLRSGPPSPRHGNERRPCGRSFSSSQWISTLTYGSGSRNLITVSLSAFGPEAADELVLVDALAPARLVQHAAVVLRGAAPAFLAALSFFLGPGPLPPSDTGLGRASSSSAPPPSSSSSASSPAVGRGPSSSSWHQYSMGLVVGVWVSQPRGLPRAYNKSSEQLPVRASPGPTRHAHVRFVGRLDDGLNLGPGVEAPTGGRLARDRTLLGRLGAVARGRQDAQTLPLVDRLGRYTDGCSQAHRQGTSRPARRAGTCAAGGRPMPTRRSPASPVAGRRARHAPVVTERRRGR